MVKTQIYQDSVGKFVEGIPETGSTASGAAMLPTDEFSPEQTALAGLSMPFRKLVRDPFLCGVGSPAVNTAINKATIQAKKCTAFHVVNPNPFYVRLRGAASMNDKIQAGEGWLWPPGFAGVYSTQYPDFVSVLAVAMPGFPLTDPDGNAWPTVSGERNAMGSIMSPGIPRAGRRGLKGDTGDRGLKGLKGDTGNQGSKGDTGATGAAGATLMGVVSLGQTAAIAIALGIREVTTALAGTVKGARYLAFCDSYKLNGGAQVAGRPSGYAIVDCVCNTDGQITVSVNAPLLAVGASYQLNCSIVRVNAA